MARSFAIPAEIEDRVHNRSAEMPHPDVIDGHAGSQRILPSGHPLSQSAPAASALIRVHRAQGRVFGAIGRMGFLRSFRALLGCGQLLLRLLHGGGGGVFRLATGGLGLLLDGGYLAFRLNEVLFRPTEGGEAFRFARRLSAFGCLAGSMQVPDFVRGDSRPGRLEFRFRSGESCFSHLQASCLAYCRRQGLPRRPDSRLAFLDLVLLNEWLEPWIISCARQLDWLDLEVIAAEKRRCPGCNRRPTFDPVPFVTAGIHVRLGVEFLVEDPDHASLHHLSQHGVLVVLEGPRVRLTRQAVLAQFQRLEERAKAEILFIRDRIIFVIVAVGAVERQAEERFARVLDGVFHPLVVVEGVPVAHQVAGGHEVRVVLRGDLIGGDHVHHHAVVAFIGVQRFHDPIAPAPDLRRAVPDIRHRPPAVPIAVPPHVHPMPRPAFAVVRAGEQVINDPFVSVTGRIIQERMQLFAARRQADQVEIDAPQQYFLRGGRTWTQAALVMFGGDEGVDGNSNPGGVANFRER